MCSRFNNKIEITVNNINLKRKISKYKNRIDVDCRCIYFYKLSQQKSKDLTKCTEKEIPHLYFDLRTMAKTKHLFVNKLWKYLCINAPFITSDTLSVHCSVTKNVSNQLKIHSFKFHYKHIFYIHENIHFCISKLFQQIDTFNSFRIRWESLEMKVRKSYNLMRIEFHKTRHDYFAFFFSFSLFLSFFNKYGIQE